jgi:hypothetical protein
MTKISEGIGQEQKQNIKLHQVEGKGKLQE